MRFSALLWLAALAGALVSAEGDSSDPAPGAAAADPGGSTPAADPAAPQKAAQEPEGAAPHGEDQSPLKSLVSRGLTLAGRRLEGAEKRLDKGRQFRKSLYDRGAEFPRNMKNFVSQLN
ncbi:extracellular glycoprotein lacritin [Vulpes vulpes]|uniref:Extracellular glycoprotein lacritin n=1 Tax=Vulpes vulpes TaxID=9627 RepID=A0A3Q7SNA9_VULVU